MQRLSIRSGDTFLAELGMGLDGEAPLEERRWLDRVVGIEDI
jgi:hypothetical protein